MIPGPIDDGAAFVFYELKRRDQSLVAEILCRKCYDERPEAAHPLTEREIQAGYRYSVKPYTGDHECMECGATRVVEKVG